MHIDKTVPLTLIATFLAAAAAAAAAANAQTQTTPPQNPPTFEDTIQVTATRFGEAVAEVPGSISVITGDEIRARGAADLRTALALLGGVSVAPGGDAGPAGAVRAARRPRGGRSAAAHRWHSRRRRFIPDRGDQSDQRGAHRGPARRRAGVFGTTAFAGTINVIHYAAEAPTA
jgi:outer membrane receptor protein involved in Fe transport